MEAQEFQINMICWSSENKYKAEEFHDMFIAFVKSKGMECGGTIHTNEDGWPVRTQHNLKSVSNRLK